MADFGQPDEVRSGLEEAHGHRLLGVVIDKALDWKEKTMRAKWLWATWAHLALAGVIALEVLWLTFAEVFLVPKFQKLVRDGILIGSLHLVFTSSLRMTSCLAISAFARSGRLNTGLEIE